MPFILPGVCINLKKIKRADILACPFQFINLCKNQKIQQHYNPQHNAVITESLEILPLNITHQEFDGDNRYHKRRHHADNQCNQLRPGKGKAEFYQLQQAGAEHNGNGHEK